VPEITICATLVAAGSLTAQVPVGGMPQRISAI
jgi:hypothetical protein